MSKFAAIFDWDGVVIDSSAQHEKSWELLAAETGRSLPTGHFKKGFGKKNQVIIQEILGWSYDPEEIRRLGDRKEELYRELVRQGRGDHPARSQGFARRAGNFRNSPGRRLVHPPRES